MGVKIKHWQRAGGDVLRRIAPALAMLGTLCLALPGLAIPGQPGTLDGTWASSSPLGAGKLMSPIGSLNDTARAVAVQPDGKIVVSGHCENGSNLDFCTARYTTAGAMDAAFGNGGKVISAIGAGHDWAHAVALQPDGKIIVAGECHNGSDYDFCLVRYSAAGVPDVSFNGTGQVLTAVGGSNDGARGLALQADGKIVVAGYCSNGSNNDFCLTRYTVTGALDAGFGSGGKVIAAIGGGNDVGRALVVQPDGKIVVAGYCDNGSNNDFCIARYSAAGALDASFGSAGVVTTAIGSFNDVAISVALQPDGKVVVAGYCENTSNYDFCVARYDAAGALDTSFNGNGKVVVSFGSSSDSNAYAMALQPDGKIMVAGRCLVFSTYDFCLARLLSTGVLDASFGNGGKVLTDIGGSGDSLFTLALQSDGKIVAAGECANGANNDFCIARYDGGPFEARNCSPDFDGDGVILATTDALILARVSLGITGNAVVNGIAFAPHARRNSWSLIRDYLVTQCGMLLVQ